MFFLWYIRNVIWLGDLNYRLASGGVDTYELLEKNDWQALLEKDQVYIWNCSLLINYSLADNHAYY